SAIFFRTTDQRRSRSARENRGTGSSLGGIISVSSGGGGGHCNGVGSWSPGRGYPGAAGKHQPLSYGCNVANDRSPEPWPATADLNPEPAWLLGRSTIRTTGRSLPVT